MSVNVNVNLVRAPMSFIGGARSGRHRFLRGLSFIGGARSGRHRFLRGLEQK